MVSFAKIENTEERTRGKAVSLVLTYENRQAYMVFPFSYNNSCHRMY